MSRSNPTLTNPAQHFFQWGGSKGKLSWWNKEEQKEVDVRLPFTFMVLDELSTITGYSKQDESGFWSNEVRSTKRDTLYVKTKKGPFEAELYENLTQTMKRGGKYAKSIYVAHKIGDAYVIGNFKASGSALSAWIEFSKKHKVQNGTITMSKGEKQESPVGDFYPPVFEYRASTPEEDEKAVELDKQLQIYLSQYLAAQAQTASEEDGVDPAIGLATPEEVADYNERKARAKAATTGDISDGGDVVIEDIGDEPINPDDVPF